MSLVVSPHFTLAELTRSQYALRRGLLNSPPQDALRSLSDLCFFVLEPIRSLVGSPIHISSGYRSPEVNAGVGGAVESQHVRGQAADFVVPGMSNRALVTRIKESGIGWDQLIYEHGEAGWVHVSHSGRPRREVLSAFHDATKGTVYADFTA